MCDAVLGAALAVEVSVFEKMVSNFLWLLRVKKLDTVF